MFRRFSFVAWAALLLCCPFSFAQQKTTVKADGPKQEYITLKVGERHVFDFSQLTKTYALEADAVTSIDPVGQAIYHDLSGKALVAFGTPEGPNHIQVRCVVDNKTVYRAIVETDRGEVKPTPSPYDARLAKAFATEGGTKAELDKLVKVFVDAQGVVSTAKTGKDVWDWIGASYSPFSTSLAGTRREIGTILGETTTSLYNVTLDATGRKTFVKVLGDIQKSLQSISASPAPTPVPVGPHQIYMVVVEEASLRTPMVAELRDNEALNQKFRDKQHKFLIIDQNIVGTDNRPPPKLVPFLEKAKGKALPYVIMIDAKTGDKLDEGPLPSTAEKIIEWLTRVGG